MNKEKIKKILDISNIKASDEIDILEYVDDLEDLIKDTTEKLELIKSTIDDEPNIARINLINANIDRVFKR